MYLHIWVNIKTPSKSISSINNERGEKKVTHLNIFSVSL